MLMRLASSDAQLLGADLELNLIEPFAGSPICEDAQFVMADGARG